MYATVYLLIVNISTGNVQYEPVIANNKSRRSELVCTVTSSFWLTNIQYILLSFLQKNIQFLAWFCKYLWAQEPIVKLTARDLYLYLRKFLRSILPFKVMHTMYGSEGLINLHLLCILWLLFGSIFDTRR